MENSEDRDKDRDRGGEGMIESTLAFQYSDRDYEAAREHPTYYRALRRDPKASHPFNIYQDALRQPELVSQTLEEMAAAAAPMAEAVIGRNIKRVLLTGIGASYHVAAAAAHSFWHFCGLPAEFVESSEALLSSPAFSFEDTLVIGLSASGNSKETVEHLAQAREAGAYTLAFVNLDKTRLTETAHDKYIAPGGYGLVWDYTTRLAALYRFSIELGSLLGEPNPHLEGAVAELNRVPSKMSNTLETIDQRCAALGVETQPLRAAVVTASGNQLPTAWESALRFEEMAHFPARGRPLVDFLHGGVGFLDSDILTLVIAPPGPTYQYAHRAVQVAQAVKTPCFAIIDEADQGGISALADGVLRVASTRTEFTPLLYILPGQLLPYYTEVARPGGNPDAQRTDQPRYARAFDIAMPPKSH